MHVLVSPEVVTRLRAIGLERDALLAVLNRLYDSLEYHSERWRNNRDPNDPDCLFDYVQILYSASDWNRLRFSVDDRLAEGFLSVVGLAWDITEDGFRG